MWHIGRVLVLVVATLVLALGTDAVTPKRNLIVDGEEAPEGRYPYVVRLELIQSSTQDTGQDSIRTYCTGALVAPDLVLTAAHCLAQSDPSQVITYVGCDFWKNASFPHEECPEPHVSTAEDFIVHPCFLNDQRNCYEETKTHEDLALIKLSDVHVDANATSIVRLIDLYEQDVPTTNVGIRLLGWGSSGEEGVRLHTLESSYYTAADCNLLYSKHGDENYEFCTEEWVHWKYGVGIGNFCSGNIEDEESSAHCQGDLGGPWIIPGSSPDYDTLVGIVPGSKDCIELHPEETQDRSDVYIGRVDVNIAYHFDWLRTAICTHSESPPDYLSCRATGTFLDDSKVLCPNNPYIYPYDKWNTQQWGGDGEPIYAMLGYNEATNKTCAASLVCGGGGTLPTQQLDGDLTEVSVGLMKVDTRTTTKGVAKRFEMPGDLDVWYRNKESSSWYRDKEGERRMVKDAQWRYDGDKGLGWDAGY